MGVVASETRRGEKIVNDNGEIVEKHAIFLSEMRTSNNEDNPKNNFRATAPPAITNNRDEGYTIGSRWIDAPMVYTLTSFAGTDANWTALN